MRKRFYLIALFSFLFAMEVAGQEIAITGKVVSQEDKEPMPGINIIIKGTSTGTATDVSGTYKINVPSPDAVLLFSFIGFESQEVRVGKRSVIDVVMLPDFKQLEEVVITGYKEENRKALPGAVAVVKSDKIQNVPIASFDQIMQGRVPGMMVTGGSGQPGTAASVTIRGIKSLSGSNGPLYVMDGVPIAAGVFQTLNPNDFESITVLKDATAAALYGSRGSNGVVVITSKRGKAGQTMVNYNFQYGISQAPQNRLQVMNSDQKIDFELLTGGTALSSMTGIEISRLRQINTNWQDVLFRQAATVQHDLNVQGGNEKTTFYASANYLSQDGTVKNTGLQRYTMKFNLQHEGNNFRMGLNTTLGYSKNQTTLEGNAYIGSPLNAVRWSNPYEKPYDDNGNYTKIQSGQPNALQEILENHIRFNDVKGVVNMYAEYFVPAVEGLSIKTSWGADYTQRNTDRYFDKSTYTGQQTPGQGGSQTRGSSYNANFVGTTSVNYHKTFDTDHDLSASAYYEIVYNQSESFSFTGYGITGNLKNDGGITVSNTYLPALGGNSTSSALRSVFAEANYGYKKKYFAKGGFRQDASSRFGRDNRNANFYSIGLNWKASDEAFFANLTNKIDFLKVYANFGTSGNQSGLGDFESLSLFQQAGANYDGSAGMAQVQPENPNLGWETVQSFNIGFEYAILKNRISGSFEFYNNTTLNMLLDAQLSRTSGFESITQNVGRMSNNGIEIDISANVLKFRGFSWNVNANFTYNKNEITKLINGDEIVNGNTIIKVGYPAVTNYVMPYAGVNPANGEALYRKKDGSLTNQFSTDDLIPYGTRIAPYFGGFTNTFNYKGVELSVFFSWMSGNKVYNNDRTNVENPTYYVDNLAVSMLNAWKSPGDITDVPRIQTIASKGGLTTDPFQAQTTRFIEDGSFLRLRNVMLSYNLPQTWMNKAKLRNVRVFVQGQNLWTWFKFQGWDPELAGGVNGGQLVGAQYPALRTITGGITIGF
ncbi:MAG TPA: TonB-dependent receptor [Cyclobacteriaceae bacterium]|nr:TonB-dependent receptor [Cyclobacteriaceae bacterium]